MLLQVSQRQTPGISALMEPPSTPALELSRASAPWIATWK